jgi:hypothetical protein
MTEEEQAKRQLRRMFDRNVAKLNEALPFLVAIASIAQQAGILTRRERNAVAKLATLKPVCKALGAIMTQLTVSDAAILKAQDEVDFFVATRAWSLARNDLWNAEQSGDRKVIALARRELRRREKILDVIRAKVMAADEIEEKENLAALNPSPATPTADEIKANEFFGQLSSSPATLKKRADLSNMAALGARMTRYSGLTVIDGGQS